jgi:hypothetical protein
MAEISVRRGMPAVQLEKAEFKKRFMTQFYDPTFQPLHKELDMVAEAAWDAYADYRKAPRTVKAGKDFSDPNYDLSVDWLQTSKTIEAAERIQKTPGTPSRILIVNGSTRSEHTCPGEMSKSYRTVSIARDIVTGTDGFELTCSICRGLPPNMAGRYIRVKPASPPLSRCATGPAPAIQTTHSDKREIG